jgi:hypothetical protein
MREVFTSQDLSEVGYYKSMLDGAGIISFIRNENTGMPAVSGAMFLPALCVTYDEDFDQAIALLKSFRMPEVSGRSDWRCPSCSEENPGNFEICWKCSHLRAAV